MRFNEPDVVYYAASPTLISTQGYLWKKGETSTPAAISSLSSFVFASSSKYRSNSQSQSPPQPDEGFRQRWCVLKGNMLFYFRTRAEHTPQGFILLEHHFVTPLPITESSSYSQTTLSESSTPPYKFKINFASPTSGREYVLGTASQDELIAWIKAIESASIGILQAEIQKLKEEVALLKGLAKGEPKAKELLKAGAENLNETTLTDQNDQTEISEEQNALQPLISERTDLDADTIMFYFSLKLSAAPPLILTPEIPITPGKGLMLAISSVPTLTNESREIAITDVADIKLGETEVCFYVTCRILRSDVSQGLTIRLNMIHQDQNPMHTQMLSSSLVKLKPDVENTQDIEFRFKDDLSVKIGSVIMKAIKPLPSRPYSLLSYITPPVSKFLSQIYTTPTTPALQIRETLIESTYPFLVPHQLLTLYIGQERAYITDLENLNTSHPKLTQSADVEIESREGWKEEGEVDGVDSKGILGLLRKSIEKVEEDVQWCTLNCVVQELEVFNGDGDKAPSRISVTTFGAPTAHALGFRKPAIPHYNITLSKLPSDIPPVDKLIAHASYQSASTIKSDITSFYKSLHSAMDRLKNVATKDTILVHPERHVSEFESLFKEVSYISRELVTLGMNLLDALKDCQIGGKPGFAMEIKQIGFRLFEETIPKFTVSGQRLLIALNPPDIESERQSADADADIKFKALSSALSTLSIPDSFSELSISMEPLVKDVHEFYVGVVALIDHYHLLLDVKFEAPPTWQTTRKRNDICFSQLLGAVVTGLVRNIDGWISHAEKIWKDILEDHVGDNDVNETKRKKVDVVDFFWQQLLHVGWFIQFESLLSSHGNEYGMLEDYRNAVNDLKTRVKLSFHPLDSASEPSSPSTSSRPTSITEIISALHPNHVKITGTRTNLTLSLGIPSKHFSALPLPLQHGKSVSIIPVLFTQGINEQQSLANVLGQTRLQDEINSDSLSTLNLYVVKYKDWIRTATNLKFSKDRVSLGMEYLDLLVRELNSLVTSGGREKLDETNFAGSSTGMGSSGKTWASKLVGTKNTDILIIADQITRVLGSTFVYLDSEHTQFTSSLFSQSSSSTSSVSSNPSNPSLTLLPPFGSHPTTTTRFISCKSAKDRTAMSVTLEQVLFIQTTYGLSSSMIENLLNTMRSEVGVRLGNVERNLTPWNASQSSVPSFSSSSSSLVHPHRPSVSKIPSSSSLSHEPEITEEDWENVSSNDINMAMNTTSARTVGIQDYKKFAFTPFQWNLIPKLYRPPKRVIRGGIQS